MSQFSLKRYMDDKNAKDIKIKLTFYMIEGEDVQSVKPRLMFKYNHPDILSTEVVEECDDFDYSKSSSGNKKTCYVLIRGVKGVFEYHKDNILLEEDSFRQNMNLPTKKVEGDEKYSVGDLVNFLKLRVLKIIQHESNIQKSKRTNEDFGGVKRTRVGEDVVCDLLREIAGKHRHEIELFFMALTHICFSPSVLDSLNKRDEEEDNDDDDDDDDDDDETPDFTYFHILQDLSKIDETFEHDTVQKVIKEILDGEFHPVVVGYPRITKAILKYPKKRQLPRNGQFSVGCVDIIGTTFEFFSKKGMGLVPASKFVVFGNGDVVEGCFPNSRTLRFAIPEFKELIFLQALVLPYVIVGNKKIQRIHWGLDVMYQSWEDQNITFIDTLFQLAVCLKGRFSTIQKRLRDGGIYITQDTTPKKQDLSHDVSNPTTRTHVVVEESDDESEEEEGETTSRKRRKEKRRKKKKKKTKNNRRKKKPPSKKKGKELRMKIRKQTSYDISSQRNVDPKFHMPESVANVVFAGKNQDLSTPFFTNLLNTIFRSSKEVEIVKILVNIVERERVIEEIKDRIVILQNSIFQKISETVLIEHLIHTKNEEDLLRRLNLVKGVKSVVIEENDNVNVLDDDDEETDDNDNTYILKVTTTRQYEESVFKNLKILENFRCLKIKKKFERVNQEPLHYIGTLQVDYVVISDFLHNEIKALEENNLLRVDGDEKNSLTYHVFTKSRLKPGTVEMLEESFSSKVLMGVC